jgi:hypothetical protein
MHLTRRGLVIVCAVVLWPVRRVAIEVTEDSALKHVF